jgi:hypothetical protein
MGKAALRLNESPVAAARKAREELREMGYQAIDEWVNWMEPLLGGSEPPNLLALSREMQLARKDLTGALLAAAIARAYGALYNGTFDRVFSRYMERETEKRRQKKDPPAQPPA